MILSINSEKELRKAYLAMKNQTGASRFVVQPMQKKGLEMIVGMKRDSSFGPILILGSGGTFTEIWKDNAILIPPISEKEIRQKIEKLAIFPVLNGFRGEKAYKVPELINLVTALQNLAAQNPGNAEIDINPVILYNDGRKPALVDVKIFVSPTPPEGQVQVPK